MPTLLRRFLAAVSLAFCALAPARAAVSIVSAGSPSASTYVLGGAAHGQTFDTLPGTGSTWANDLILPGWSAISGAGTLASVAVNALDGTANPPDLVLASVGTAGSSERAFAYHTRVAATPTHLGLAFVNNSGRELTAFSLAYAAEQWKESTNQRTVTVTVHYRVGATFADLHATSGWTELPTLSANTLNGAAGASTARSITDVPVSVPAGSSFWLRWTFSNSATTSTSSHDLLAIDNVVFSATAPAVDAAPVFTTHPASRTVSLDNPVTFTSAASGNPAPTYQWYKGLDPIGGATSASYTIAHVAATDAGDYSVVATNSLGSDTSDVATLTVSTVAVPPTIGTPPSDVTAPAGTPATFSVVATGTAPLSYQWFKGVDPIPGATSTSYTIPSVSITDEAEYSVTVTNSAGSTPSVSAYLDVLLTPAIETPPASQTVAAGVTVTFTVVANGEGTLTYQWRKGTDNLSGQTSASLVLTNVQLASAGSYSVVVTNSAGSTPSQPAILTVNAPPTITAPPASRAAYVGEPATFTVTATGTAPLRYQWRRGGENLSGETGPSLTLANTQLSDSGATFDVIVTNDFGSVPSGVAILTVTNKLPDSAFNLTGFATLGAGTTGGGVVAETAATYRKCYTAFDFVKAISDSSKTAGAVRVIEVMNDLDLGNLEVDDATRALGNFRAHAAPKLHPRLLVTGVSLIDVATKGGGLTIFSANGSTLRHTCLNLKGTSNIIIRNLRFDEMWEWDETSKGDYDSNDWDFIDFSNGSAVTNIWIDHCTFTKAYDGIADLKKGTQYVTFSWCRYVGDDGVTNPNSFVRQQLNALEANRPAYAFYNFLRNNGFSKDDIAQVIQGHDKGHLMGATEKDPENDILSATFHHQWFENIWDRCVPRLRGGQVHNYNIYVDDSVALVAKRLRDTRKAAMGSAAQTTLENTYSFNPFLNGSISTEGAAILVEKSVYLDCLTPLRNNQTDVNDPTYTGKIKSSDSIYIFHNANGTTTTVRGDSTDAGNPMGPFQAAQIPFAWNTPDGSRPYPAPPMDDPANLHSVLQAGAGAGRLTWAKSNWLLTTYIDPPATAPAVTTPPLSQTIASGQAATLTVVASGTAPLAYQWYRGASPDTSQPVGTDSPGYTTPALTATTSYWVRVTNSAGAADSATATLTVNPTFSTWASDRGLSGPAAEPAADTDGDGVSLLLEYALGLDPAVADASPSAFPALAHESGGALTFRFTRPKSLSDLAYSVETTASLATAWAPSSVTPVVESATSTTETLTVTLPAASPALFVRLRVTRTP